MATRRKRPAASGGSLSLTEETLLTTLRNHPNGTDIDTLREELGDWSDSSILECMNALSSKQYVDFISLGKSKKLAFRARSAEEATKTVGMKDEERVIYRLVKEAKNNGIWLKQLKDRSGLHVQLANTVIKNLEKKNIIKWVKPVKNPYKKVYLLFELEPSTELTGGAWYTDNEMDMDFIEQLSEQVYKYIVLKSFPSKKPSAIFPASYTSYPTASHIHKFVTKHGLTTVPLGQEDVQTLLDRLYYDGKVTRILKVGHDFSDSEPDDREMDQDSEDDMMDGAEQVRDMDSQRFMYKAVKGAALEERNAWTDMPCGRCPVFSFCSENGPVNPSNCRYFKEWLMQD